MKQKLDVNISWHLHQPRLSGLVTEAGNLSGNFTPLARKNYFFKGSKGFVGHPEMNRHHLWLFLGAKCEEILFPLCFLICLGSWSMHGDDRMIYIKNDITKQEIYIYVLQSHFLTKEGNSWNSQSSKSKHTSALNYPQGAVKPHHDCMIGGLK